MKTPIARPITRIGDGSHVGWSLYVEDYEGAVETMAEVIYSKVLTSGDGPANCARAALESIGITAEHRKKAMKPELPKTAWMRTEDGFAIICCRCPDRAVAEQRATAAGLKLSHGHCPECNVEAIAEMERFFAAGGLSHARADRENGAGEAQENRVGTALSMNAKTSLVAGPAGRLYVLARDVAEVCGVSVLALDTRHRPAGWGCPHDFKLNADYALLFALEVLPQLADSLQANGEVDAALRLRKWAVGLLVEAMNFDAGQTAGAPQSEKLDTAAAPSTAPAPAARVDSTAPQSRLLAWEAEHQ